MALLPFAPTLPLRVLAVALYGSGCGSAWPMPVVLSTRLFPGRSGSAMGMMMLATMCGLTVFPYLIGSLPRSLTLTFLAAPALAALVILISPRAGRQADTPNL